MISRMKGQIPISDMEDFLINNPVDLSKLGAADPNFNNMRIPEGRLFCEKTWPILRTHLSFELKSRLVDTLINEGYEASLRLEYEINVRKIYDLKISGFFDEERLEFKHTDYTEKSRKERRREKWREGRRNETLKSISKKMVELDTEEDEDLCHPTLTLTREEEKGDISHKNLLKEEDISNEVNFTKEAIPVENTTIIGDEIYSEPEPVNKIHEETHVKKVEGVGTYEEVSEDDMYYLGITPEGFSIVTWYQYKKYEVFFTILRGATTKLLTPTQIETSFLCALQQSQYGICTPRKIYNSIFLGDVDLLDLGYTPRNWKLVVLKFKHFGLNLGAVRKANATLLRQTNLDEVVLRRIDSDGLPEISPKEELQSINECKEKVVDRKIKSRERLTRFLEKNRDRLGKLKRDLNERIKKREEFLNKDSLELFLSSGALMSRDVLNKEKLRKGRNVVLPGVLRLFTFMTIVTQAVAVEWPTFEDMHDRTHRWEKIIYSIVPTGWFIISEFLDMYLSTTNKFHNIRSCRGEDFFVILHVILDMLSYIFLLFFSNWIAWVRISTIIPYLILSLGSFIGVLLIGSRTRNTPKDNFEFHFSNPDSFLNRTELLMKDVNTFKPYIAAGLLSIASAICFTDISIAIFITIIALTLSEGYAYRVVALIDKVNKMNRGVYRVVKDKFKSHWLFVDASSEINNWTVNRIENYMRSSNLFPGGQIDYDPARINHAITKFQSKFQSKINSNNETFFELSNGIKVDIANILTHTDLERYFKIMRMIVEHDMDNYNLNQIPIFIQTEEVLNYINF